MQDFRIRHHLFDTLQDGDNFAAKRAITSHRGIVFLCRGTADQNPFEGFR